MRVEDTWLVARSRQHREALAADNMRRQGFDVYLPRVQHIVRYPRLMMIVRPLFEGYLLVRYRESWYSLLGTFGVAGVVMSSDTRPALMPGSEVDRLRSREHDGIVKLPPKPRLKPGDKVRVKTGVMAGQVGLYEGMPKHDRVMVLLECLGGKRKVLLAESDVELA